MKIAIQFDSLFINSNRPTAHKDAYIVYKINKSWGYDWHHKTIQNTLLVFAEKVMMQANSLDPDQSTQSSQCDLYLYFCFIHILYLFINILSHCKTQHQYMYKWYLSKTDKQWGHRSKHSFQSPCSVYPLFSL